MTWSETQKGISDKNAEIERLKAENEITVRVCNENTDLKKLITELADVLRDVLPYPLHTELVRRAREATR
jgi:hypothetical protein